MLPQRLKSARLRSGLSLERLGILAGIEESTARSRMSGYEKGTHVPRYDLVCSLAKVLDMPEGYFYTKDDELAELLLVFYQAKQNTNRP